MDITRDDDESEPDFWARWHRDQFAEPAPWRRVYRDGVDITDTVPPEEWPWPWRDDGKSHGRSSRR